MRTSRSAGNMRRHRFVRRVARGVVEQWPRLCGELGGIHQTIAAHPDAVLAVGSSGMRCGCVGKTMRAKLGQEARWFEITQTPDRDPMPDNSDADVGGADFYGLLRKLRRDGAWPRHPSQQTM